MAAPAAYSFAFTCAPCGTSSHWATIICGERFFKAEDAIRDNKVTGVQTCALPICVPSQPAFQRQPLLETSTTRSPGRYTPFPRLPARSTGLKHCSRQIREALIGSEEDE